MAALNILSFMAIFELAIAIPSRDPHVNFNAIFDVKVYEDEGPNNNQNCPCCPFDWSPVCGADDGHSMSFSNQCFLNLAIKCDPKFENYKLLHDKECYSTTTRTSTTEPTTTTIPDSTTTRTSTTEPTTTTIPECEPSCVQNQGICVNGICQCNAGFCGNDCSVIEVLADRCIQFVYTGLTWNNAKDGCMAINGELADPQGLVNYLITEKINGQYWVGGEDDCRFVWGGRKGIHRGYCDSTLLWYICDIVMPTTTIPPTTTTLPPTTTLLTTTTLPTTTITTTPLTTTPGISACRDGFINYRGYCLKRMVCGGNYNASIICCSDLGATMAYPAYTDGLKNWQTAIVEAHGGGGYYWAGARQKGNGNWTWVDGTQVTSAAWKPGEPGTGGHFSVGSCGWVYFEKALLRDKDCNDGLTPICQAFPTCRDGFINYRGYCLTRSTPSSNYDAAAAYCSSLQEGATLAYPAYIDDLTNWQTAIVEIYGGILGYDWVGARKQVDGTWTWVDGTQVTSAAWKPGEPGTGGHFAVGDCGWVYFTNGLLRDEPCNTIRAPICQSNML